MGGYVYCAGNPVRLVDVDGRKIGILGEDGTVVEYSVGMVYGGKDNFVSKVVNYLNAMGEVRAGDDVLLQVCDSEKQINFVREPSNAGTNSFQFVRGEDGVGGNIRAVAFTGSMSDANKVEGAAHELFHAYQFINGRNIFSANAEVEAILFGNGIAANSKYRSEYYQFISGNLTQYGRVYEKSMLSLMTDPLSESEFFDVFNEAAASFSKGNMSSYTGKYRSQNEATYVPLIRKFLPLR